MPRRSRQLAALAIAVLALAGCQRGADPNATPPTTATPSTAPGTATPSTATPTAGASPNCNHPAVIGSEGGLQVDWDYEESHHDFGAGAPLTLCFDVRAGVVMVTGSSPEVTVTPETLPGPGTQFTFTVTVQPGATGNLDVRFGDEAGEAGEAGVSFNGPAIMTDETGWNFGPWG